MTVIISDHALVRRLERAHDIDMDSFRGQLADLAAPYAAARVRHVEIGGLWFIFEGAVLVTVRPDRPSPHSMYRNDKGGRNGTNMRAEKLHWKGAKRRRDHR